MAYLLILSTWAGCTVRQLYHNTETVMNQGEKGYVLSRESSGRGDFAERDEIGFNGDAFGNFHVKQSLKGLESAGVGYGEAQEEFLNGFFATGIFNGPLSAEGGGAGNDHDGTRRVETRDEGDKGVVFGEGGIGR